MKTALILFNGNTINTPKKGPLGYDALYTFFAKKNITFCRAPISFYDSHAQTFQKAQFYINDQWICKSNIAPDLVYDKSSHIISDTNSNTRQLIAERFPFYNDLKLSEIMSDKSLTYQHFKSFSPKTITVNDPEDLSELQALTTSQIIVKPLSQSGGNGIFVTRREFLKKRLLSKNLFPVIVQDFIDSSKIQNAFVNGCHDVRIIIRNTTPFYAFVRTPQKGKLTANVSQGASLKVLPIDDLLSNANVKGFIENIMHEVERIDSNNKLYAIDFMFDNSGKLWLVEMNSRPGLTLEESESFYQKDFYENLLIFFNSL